MRPELQKQFADEYSSLFRHLGGNPMETCMAFGICIGDGWAPLLKEFCEAAKNQPDVTFDQIKEKFGLLRIYYSGGDEKLGRLCNELEDKSGTICEHCGSKENVTTDGIGWISTLCTQCRGNT